MEFLVGGAFIFFLAFGIGAAIGLVYVAFVALRMTVVGLVNFSGDMKAALTQATKDGNEQADRWLAKLGVPVAPKSDPDQPPA